MLRIMIRMRFVILLGVAVALVLSGPGLVWSQSGEEKLKVVAPPRWVRSPEFIAPSWSREVTRPREADFRPDNIRVQHDPAFLVPFSIASQTRPDSAVRYGLSGWAAPPGRGDHLVSRENSGWFALGLSIVWSGPVKPLEPNASPVAPR